MLFQIIFLLGNWKLVPLSAHIYTGDYGDKDLLRTIIDTRNVTEVIHLAASTFVHEGETNPGSYYDNNVYKLLNLIEVIEEKAIQTVIFSSSAAVYGNPSSPLPINEASPLNPINVYGKTKRIGEALFENRKFNYVALRFFNAAGANLRLLCGEIDPNNNHLIKAACYNAIRGIPVKIFGWDYNTPNGTAIRDYVHVEDITSAHLYMLDCLRDESGQGIYNIGYGVGYSNLEIMERLSKFVGFKFEFAPRRIGDPDILVADNTKIKNIGWKPMFNIDTILDSALKWENYLPNLGIIK